MRKLWIVSIHWNWIGCEFNEETKTHFCSGFDMSQKFNTGDSDHSNYVIMCAIPNTLFIASVFIFSKLFYRKVSKNRFLI